MRVHTCIMICTHIHGICSADKLVYKIRLLRHLLCVSIKRNVPGKYYIYTCIYLYLHVMMSEYIVILSVMQLSNEERLAIAQRVARTAAGRVPVVAGGI